MRGYRPKRALDLLLGATAAVVLLPLAALVALAVRLRMGPPVLFRQKRIGWREREFVIFKFRTMLPGNGPDDGRLTALGRWLRRTSLDELPQLWNVLRGEMSLVGPRPLLPQYLPRYSARQRLRHAAPPGITGWAQVNGRTRLGWAARLELDVWYVEHRSLRLDLAILARTLLRVARRADISHGDHATSPEFRGQGAA